MNQLFEEAVKRNFRRDSRLDLLGAHDDLKVSEIVPPPCSLNLVLRAWGLLMLSDGQGSEHSGYFSISKNYDTLTRDLERISPISKLVKSRLHKIIHDLKSVGLIQEQLPPQRSADRDRRPGRQIRKKIGRPSLGIEIDVNELIKVSVYPWFWPDSDFVGIEVGSAIEFCRLIAVGSNRASKALPSNTPADLRKYILSYHLACLERQRPEIKIPKARHFEGRSFRAYLLKHSLLELGASPMQVDVFHKSLAAAISES